MHGEDEGGPEGGGGRRYELFVDEDPYDLDQDDPYDSDDFGDIDANGGAPYLLLLSVGAGSGLVAGFFLAGHLDGGIILFAAIGGGVFLGWLARGVAPS